MKPPSVEVWIPGYGDAVVTIAGLSLEVDGLAIRAEPGDMSTVEITLRGVNVQTRVEIPDDAGGV